jgi:glycosyltransferase involved in cell wall biosynthesis
MEVYLGVQMVFAGLYDSETKKTAMKKCKFTVYIVSHNYGKFLGDSIESVLRQSVEDWELLIIDDNSTDNTREVMNLYKGDPRIRLYSTPGIGLPAVCNFALRQARGAYIIRLDGDDILDENILLVLGSYLDQHSEAALVFPDCYLMDENGEVFAQEKRHKIYEHNHMLDMPPNGACTLVRREVFDELGGYREDLGVQDGFDLWCRMSTRYKAGNVNLPLFYYRRHGKNLTDNVHRILHARRTIKQDAISENIEKLRPLTAVIPCRRNYDFCIDLWKQEIGGKSLLQRDIELCLQSSILDHIVVACDNAEAERIVRMFDESRLGFCLRDPKDTIRSKSIAVTLEKIVASIDPSWKGITAVSYIQTPFVTKGTLEEAIFSLVMAQADSSFGVEEIESPLYRKTGYGLKPINPPRGFTTDFDTIYRESNTFLATKNRNLKSGSLTGATIANFVVSKKECFMIDSEMDLEVARMLVKAEE